MKGKLLIANPNCTTALLLQETMQPGGARIQNSGQRLSRWCGFVPTAWTNDLRQSAMQHIPVGLCACFLSLPLESPSCMPISLAMPDVLSHSFDLCASS